MIGVVVAAGRGARMRTLTDSRPKCLLPIGHTTLLDHAVDQLLDAGCQHVVVITGYMHALVELHLAGRPQSSCLHNTRAPHTNVLQSLMLSRHLFVGDVLITYSDTILDRSVFDCILATPGQVVIAVDVDWKGYYEGRSEHGIDEAEKVSLGHGGFALEFGKHLQSDSPSGSVGEFAGLMLFRSHGAATLRDLFEHLDARLLNSSPFQHAEHWSQAYVTDLLQEYVDRGGEVIAAQIRRGWAEIDTPEDYLRLPQILERQRVTPLRATDRR